MRVTSRVKLDPVISPMGCSLNTRTHLPKQALVSALGLVLATHSAAAGPLASAVASREPDYEVAASWWPPLNAIITPVGWKDHFFRFNVLFDGTLIARTDPQLSHGAEVMPRTQKWKGLGVQLAFWPTWSGGFPPPRRYP